MKAEIVNGGIKWTVEATDGTLTPDDLVSVTSSCHVSMSSEGFERLFFKYVNCTETYVEAYEKAEAIHEKICGRRRYSDWDSFRVVKNRRK